MKKKNIQTHTKKLNLIVLTCCILLVSCSCSIKPKTNSVSKTGFYFDTIITITLYDCTDTSYIDECFSIAETYENMFSNTIVESEISQINANAGTYIPITVSDDTLALLLLSKEINTISNGAFNITLGNISDLWNISKLSQLSDEDNPNNVVTDYTPPTDEAIGALLTDCKMDALVIEGNQVYLTNSNANLDIGGIAKGYIADQMKDYLVSLGITSGIINLGGNIVCIGPKSDASDYKIGIRDPFNTSSILGSVGVPEGSIVTSGVYERFITYQNTRYHHVLDPSTGYPSNSGLVSATIIGPDSAKCDALSTACLVLGKEDALSLIENSDDYECILITTEKEVITSTGLSDNFSITNPY